MLRTLRLLDVFGIAVLFTLLIVTGCLAQSTPTTVVSFDLGTFLNQVGTALVPWAATALIGVLTLLLPAPIRAFLDAQRTAQVEQLLERGLGFGVSKLSADLAGKPITVDVKNSIVASALQYALDHGSATLLNYIGGQTALQQKLVARLPTSPAVATVGAA